MSSGGSMGVRYWIEPLRFAAAQAREMLVAAAAVRLGVPTTELVAADGTVSHAASGRHLAYGELVAELDADDRVIGLHVRAPGPAISRSFTGLSPNTDLDTHVDMQALQNLAEARYRVGALKLDYAMRHNHVPAGPWRAVGATQCTFFLESFVDERARATDKDPLALRCELLSHDARALRVVETAAEQAGWGVAGRGTPQRPLAPGRALGLAYYECYGSLCAHVAEVSRGADGLPRVHRVICALDCGEVVTPDGARAQVEGGIIQGLSAAVANALARLDGTRLRRLPLIDGIAKPVRA